MPSLKLVLTDTLEYDFSLYAIHCSLEDYRIAYFLNKHLEMRLERRQKDADFKKETYEALFSLFIFEDSRNYRTFTLVANKSKVKQQGQSREYPGLFKEQQGYDYTSLVPELKKADYFLKLESEIPASRTLVSQIKKIPQVITAYEVAVNQLKSKQNLIFE